MLNIIYIYTCLNNCISAARHQDSMPMKNKHLERTAESRNAERVSQASNWKGQSGLVKIYTPEKYLSLVAELTVSH